MSVTSHPTTRVGESPRAVADRPGTNGPQPATDSRARVLAMSLVAAAFVLAYGLLAELSDSIAAAGGGAAAWFPPVGLSLAAVLLFGSKAIPLVVLADALQLVARGGGDAFEIAVFALTQGAIWGGVGLALRRRLAAQPPLSRMADLGWFAFIGVIGGAALAALIGSALLIALRDGVWGDYWDIARRYFAGDAIGVMTVTPALLLLAGWVRRGTPWHRETSRPARELLLQAVATIIFPIVAVAAFDGVLLPIAPLPVAFVALRTGISGAGIAVAGWSLVAALTFWAVGSDAPLDAVTASLLSGGLLALCIGAVVSERERGRARLAYLALHDELTGLHNKRGFLEELGAVLARDERSDVAILVVRFDRVSAIAELGPRALDSVLLTAADRLRNHTTADATIARLGGRRFVVLLEGPAAAQAEQVAARVLRELERPVEFGGLEQLLSPVVGLARGGQGETPELVIDHAARAAHRASTVEGVAFYDEEMRAESRAREDLARDLRHALETDALHLAFQPIIALRSGEVLGAEALLRWTHPGRGPVPPSEFIPVAEECGLILPLGRWVLEQACATAKNWPNVSEEPLVVNVNVSPVQLRDERLQGDVRAVLQRTGLEPHRLCLELTESAVLDDLDVAVASVNELSALGLQVVLDDFGTGHSSLSWLQRLPVSALKIDRSFINGVDTEPVNQAIVGATLGLAKAMHLTTVAEGVETPEQLQVLRTLGCPSVQGYLVCRPVPAAEFHQWLLEYSGGPLLGG